MMKCFSILIVLFLSIMTVQANTDLTCTGDLSSINNEVFESVTNIQAKYQEDNLTLSFQDEDGLNVVSGVAEFDYITYHYIIMIEDTGIVLDIINMEGKALWEGEFLSKIKCSFL